MKLRLHREAREELDSACDWISSRDQRKAEEFVEAVANDMEVVRSDPGRWPPATGAATGVHRFRMARFPYSIYYSFNEEEVFVLAIAHAKRRPLYWRGRLTD